MRNYQVAVKRLLKHEGGFQDSAFDRGNWSSGTVGVGELRGTKYGISAMSYPELDIKNLKIEEAIEIYRQDWWMKLDLDAFDFAISYQLLDASVNMGIRRTVKLLQTALGITPDGVAGPQTRMSIRNSPTAHTAILFIQQRLLFVVKIKTFNEFGRGWTRRIAENLEYLSEDLKR